MNGEVGYKKEIDSTDGILFYKIRNNLNGTIVFDTYDLDDFELMWECYDEKNKIMQEKNK